MAKLDKKILKKPLISQRLKEYPLTRLIPNITTLLGLSVGLSAVYYAHQTEWDKALWFVVIATVFDGMDGRLARLFNASSRFGAELDSLSDFVTFGVSPALILYFYTLQSAGRLGWAVVLFYCICSGLRLARFNTISIENEDLAVDVDSEKLKKFFIGIPMPAAALLVLVPIMLELDTEYVFFPEVYVGVMLFISILMVSKLPTYSFKTIKLKPYQVMPLLAVVGLFMIGVVTRPWITLAILGGAYISSFIFSISSYYKSKKNS